MKRRFWLALGAVVATLGLTLSASVPAQAANYSVTRTCDWPRRAVIKVAPYISGARVYVEVYSLSGYRLGSNAWYGTYTWWTKWEDARFYVTVNTGATVTTSCF